MLPRNRVDCAQNVPVNESSTWWSGHRSFIDPSFFTVHHFHQIAIVDQVNWIFLVIFVIWILGTDCVPFQRVEERIDDFLLGPSELRCVFFNGEHDTDGGIPDLIFSFFCQMDGMHFKVHSLAVNGMLRASMEMELSSAELCCCSE